MKTCSVVTVVTSFALLSSMASAASISVNFHVGDDDTGGSPAQADHELAQGEIAGLVPVDGQFWNNINVGARAAHNSAGAIFPSTPLTDDMGNATAATLAPSVDSTWFVGYAASAASANEELPSSIPGEHEQLFNSYLALNGPGGDGSPADAAVLNVTGISSDFTSGGYNLILYSDSDRRDTSNNSRQSLFTVTPAGGSPITVFTEDDDPAETVNIFDGTYLLSDNVEDGADYSNYVVISGLTADSLTIDLSSPDGGRGAFSGFQIVAVPEPGSLASLLFLSAAAAIGRRRIVGG